MSFSNLKQIYDLSLNSEPTRILTRDRRKITVSNVSRSGETGTRYYPDWAKIDLLSGLSHGAPDNNAILHKQKKRRTQL